MTVLLAPEELTLDDLVTDPMLEEIWINGPNQVFVAEGGVSRPVTIEITAPRSGLSWRECCVIPADESMYPVLLWMLLFPMAHASRVVSRYGVSR